jgi:hypothetical protein
MPLSTEQQLLLHAYVDCECSPAESEAARELLQSPATAHEAVAYLREINRLCDLVRDCNGVQAPRELHERVLWAVRAECAGRMYRPRFGVWIAAAAALAVAVGVVLGRDALFDTGGETPRVAQRPQATQPATSLPVEMSLAPGAAALPKGAVDAEREKSAHRQFRAAAPTTISLDRGTDSAPLEVLVEFNRDRNAGVLQVYTDLLTVASMHGRAELVDGTSDPSFAGHDFGQCDAVRVLVSSGLLAELVGSLQSLADTQRYGAMLIPADLVHAAREAARRALLLCNTPADAPGLETWMPSRMQRLSRDPAGSRADQTLVAAAHPQTRPNTLVLIKLR